MEKKTKFNDTDAELGLFSELEKGNFKSVPGLKALYLLFSFRNKNCF